MHLMQKLAVAVLPVLAGPAVMTVGLGLAGAVQAEEVLKPVKLMTTQSIKEQSCLKLVMYHNMEGILVT